MNGNYVNYTDLRRLKNAVGQHVHVSESGFRFLWIDAEEEMCEPEQWEEQDRRLGRLPRVEPMQVRSNRQPQTKELARQFCGVTGHHIRRIKAMALLS